MKQTLPLLGAAAVLLVACNGTDTLVDSTSADALTTAQCTYQGYDTESQSCFDAFTACVASAGTDCQAALDACSPAAPAGSHEGHGSGDGCSGGNGGGGSKDGGHSDGGKGKRGNSPVDSAALTACKDAFTACVAADPTAADACNVTKRACVKAEFVAQFQAKCAEALATCATDVNGCDEINARCSEGVDGVPAGSDGGTCQ